MNRQELAQHLGVSQEEIARNFPKIAVKEMKNGIEILREGKGENTIYTLKEVEPQTVDKNYFSKAFFAIAVPTASATIINKEDLTFAMNFRAAEATAEETTAATESDSADWWAE